MAVSQTLSVTEVSGSVITAANTSKVRILWTSTQTNNSHNNNTKTAKYYVSINGGAETEYSVSYTLPLTSTKTIVDTTITVTHKTDGTGTVSVRTWMDTSISAGVVQKTKSLTLTTIPRASTITSVSDRTLGEACSVAWTPLSAAYRYKLKFSIGDWEYTTPAIHPNTTSLFTYTGYNLSLDAANKIPKTTGTMTASLFTYSDSNASVQVGASSPKTFTVTVPNNEATKPAVSMQLTPVVSLGGPFSSLYIQGKSRVEAALSGEGKYGATVTSVEFYVDGKSNGALVSDYLSKSGKAIVLGRVYDSRGYYNEATEEINVIPYEKPQIKPVSGESEVIAARCDASGNIIDSGTYLKIKAKRQYRTVESHNHCQIRYRYKVEGGEYHDWVTILASSATNDEVVTGALLSGALSPQKTYYVQVQAIDDLGEYSLTTISIPTDEAYLHKAASINALGIGKYAEEENTIDVAEHITTKLRGNASFLGEVAFEGGANIQGKAIADFIEAVGTDGIWTYRKWHSGIAECWGLYNIDNVSIDSAWGSALLETSTGYQANFPTGLFVSAPVLSLTAQSSWPNGVLCLETMETTTNEKTCLFYPIRPGATVVVTNLVIALRATGRWK